MNKQKELDKIAATIAKCRMCKSGKTGLPVPGEGNPDARIMFIGEAPGKKEAASGRPFIGRSGQLLRKIIREAGLLDDEVFITSPVKYLPKRGTPSAEHIRHGRKHLKMQIDVINPEILVLLGNTACKAILEAAVPVLSLHGKIIERDNRKFLVTLHPAAVLRFPKYLPILKSDFRKMASLINDGKK